MKFLVEDFLLFANVCILHKTITSVTLLDTIIFRNNTRVCRYIVQLKTEVISSCELKLNYQKAVGNLIATNFPCFISLRKYHSNKKIFDYNGYWIIKSRWKQRHVSSIENNRIRRFNLTEITSNLETTITLLAT